MPRPRPRARQMARDALEEAISEARRAVDHLEQALDEDALNEPGTGPAFVAEASATERLVTVAKSLLNDDGVYTRYDLALAIRDIEGPQN